MQNTIRQSENLSSPAYQWLGDQEYCSFLEKMQQQVHLIRQNQADEVIYFCEHQPVYTTGKRGVNNSKCALPAPLIATERGGETTYHGTGQLMMYPIINLKKHSLSVRNYVHLLEQSCIDLLAFYHINAQRDCGFPGVWLEQKKIAALGIRVSQGITSHGIALNVSTDLTWFSHINPCGTSRKATSMHNQSIIISNLESLAQQWHQLFLIRLISLVEE